MVMLLPVYQSRYHHRHAPALKIEWDLIDLAVGVLQLQTGGDIHALQHRSIQQIF